MIQERIQVWPFDHAPRDLRKMHTGHDAPEWLLLIPASLRHRRFEDWIRNRKSLNVRQYNTELGDIVYIGSNRPAE